MPKVLVVICEAKPSEFPYYRGYAVKEASVMSIRITRVSHRKLNSGMIKSGEAATFGGEFGV